MADDTSYSTIEATQHHVEGIVANMDDYLRIRPQLFPRHDAVDPLDHCPDALVFPLRLFQFVPRLEKLDGDLERGHVFTDRLLNAPALIEVARRIQTA